MQKHLENISLVFSTVLSSMAFCYLNSIRPDNIIVFGTCFLALLLFKTRYKEKCSASIAVLSIILSLLLLLGKYLVYLDESTGFALWLKIVITPLGAFLFFCDFFSVLFAKAENIRVSEKRTIGFVPVFVISFVVILAAWIPAWLAEYPGIFSPDTIAQLNQVEGLRAFDNFNPLLHTLMVAACRALASVFTKDINVIYFVVGLIQMVILALIYAYSNAYIYRRTGKISLLILSLIFYTLISYNVFYSISVSKDSMYAAFALLLVIAVDRYGNEPTLKNAVILIVCGIIYGLLRKNGFYSLLFTFVVLVFLWLKRDFRKTVTVFATMLILITVIERPVYSTALSVLNKNVITAQSNATLMLEDESMATDAYSISFRRGENTKTNEVHFRGNFLYVMFFQQVANVVCHDRKLTAEEEHMIEEMIPISVIKKTYNPMLVDELFNMAAAYATEEAERFGFFGYFRLWAGLLFRYPLDYLEAYVNMTKYYFYPNRFVNTYYIGVHTNEFGLSSANLLSPEYKSGVERFYSRNQNSLPLVSSLYCAGTFTFILLATIFFTMRKKNYTFLLSLLPLLGNFLILMACVPINDEFRYMYPIVVCLPYYVMQFLVKDNAQTEAQGGLRN